MRIEVPFTAGDHAVVAVLMPIEAMGYWHHTWSYRAAEAISIASLTKMAPVGIDLTRAIAAEGDALFGHGGRVHVRLEGEAPPP